MAWLLEFRDTADEDAIRNEKVDDDFDSHEGKGKCNWTGRSWNTERFGCQFCIYKWDTLQPDEKEEF